jgi:MFS transporter, LPLT family, lysophospholipid transporter
MPRSFYFLLAVQAISSLADSAFLIIAIARVFELAGPDWVIPLLKLSFTLFYVLLAPFVGPLADAYPKGRVMVASNALKVFAVMLLILGLDPLIAIAIAGFGAAIYAPAKYGLITELVPVQSLVKANGMFEGATVCAVILGTALGGLLISPAMVEIGLKLGLGLGVSLGLADTSSLIAAMACLLLLNLLATGLSMWVADSGARYPKRSAIPYLQIRHFFKDNSKLWRDPLGGLSMQITTLLWGVGATLQLIVLRWANEFLGLSLTQAAYLQGLTALGVIAGAMLASRWVQITQATQLIPIGVLMGMLLPLMLAVQSVLWAMCLVVVVGALAGFFLVPMNALLQHRGCTLLTAGRSIAVQGFNENAGMLLMLALYSGATALDLSLSLLIAGFSVFVTLGMLLIYLAGRKVITHAVSQP